MREKTSDEIRQFDTIYRISATNLADYKHYINYMAFYDLYKN